MLPKLTSDICSQFESTSPPTSVRMSKVKEVNIFKAGVVRIFEGNAVKISKVDEVRTCNVNI